ncbi:MAG: roadblock/LC7 domain-containing protein [Calditrichaeota bacterium]|nr:MAG: roadblock/LC7 domain-containing protein [Calditrichota bacterium]
MSSMNKENGKQLILSQDAYEGISKILDELAAKTAAQLVVFCEANGYPVTHKGDLSGVDLPAISSLAANNFSATAQMASMIGEKDSFQFLFHEGEKRNIYLSNVGFNFILLLVFDVQVALGMVRIFTRRAIDELQRLLRTVKQEEEKSREFLDLEFKTLLSEELNRSF